MIPCKQSPLATACLAVLAAFTLPALAGANPGAADAATLATTVVTASRAPEQVDASLATVSVIDRERIQASQAHNLLELLRQQAGIDLARTGGPGSAISLFLRGTNSNHVLVLVDGVRVSSMNTGALDWSNLPLAQIERIEIVRGPRAAYWGSDAIGGVIQVFTRRLAGASLAVHAGSRDTQRIQAGLGADTGRAHLSLVVGHDRSDGFSAQNEDAFNYWPDADGYRQRSLGLSAGVTLGRQELGLRLFRARNEAAFDNGEAEALMPAVSDGLSQTLALELAGTLAGGWHHQLVLGNGRDDLTTPANQSHFQTRRQSLDWQNQFALAPGSTVLFGLNWLEEEGFAADGFGDPYAGRRDNLAGYLGWRARHGRVDTELVGRYDDNSDYGGEFTASAALGWQAGPRLRLGASLGEGFRAPNLNELYSPGFGGWYLGNPQLEPERSRSAELAADLGLGRAGNLRLRAFRTDIRQMISFTGQGIARAENTARARIDGVELEYAWVADGWLLNASATWQDPRDRESGQTLLRRARYKAAASLDRELGRGWRAGIDTVLVGSRQDAGFPENLRLGGYGLIGLRASWAMTADWTLEARVDNVGDRDYTLVHGFNTAGRSAHLGLRWQPAPR